MRGVAGVLPLSPVSVKGRWLKSTLLMVEDDLRLEALGVFQETLDQRGALHAMHVGGPVVDLGGGGELPLGPCR